MPNRDSIKWAPFNSVINGDDVIKELKEEQNRINKPTLSEDQIRELETLILEVTTDKSLVEIIFYRHNHLYKVTGIITNIDPIQKKITINNQNSYYFKNIIKIIRKNT